MLSDGQLKTIAESIFSIGPVFDKVCDFFADKIENYPGGPQYFDELSKEEVKKLTEYVKALEPNTASEAGIKAAILFVLEMQFVGLSDHN